MSTPEGKQWDSPDGLDALSGAAEHHQLLLARVRPGPNWLLPLIELLVPRALGATASVRVLYCGGGTATQTNP
jgi:hypothetical protein